MFAYAFLLCFPALMALAGAMDLLTMTIPNRISLLLVAAFAIAVPFSGMTGGALLSHLGAGALMLAIGIVLFAYGGFGGGDAKLLAAGALWMGFDHLAPFLIGVSLAGGVLAIVILMYRQFPMVLQLPPWAERLHERGTGIPYGIAIAAAALMVYPDTAWFPALAA